MIAPLGPTLAPNCVQVIQHNRNRGKPQRGGMRIPASVQDSRRKGPVPIGARAKGWSAGMAVPAKAWAGRTRKPKKDR